jgi:hypothetical protein
VELGYEIMSGSGSTWIKSLMWKSVKNSDPLLHCGMGLLLALTLCAINGCALVGQRQNRPTLGEILAHAEDFNGKTVVLTGILHLSYEGDGLCSGEYGVSLRYHPLEGGVARVVPPRYQNKEPGPFRIRGRFQIMPEKYRCPPDEMMCFTPQVFIHVYQMDEIRVPKSAPRDDPAYSCARDEPKDRSPVDSAEIEWVITSMPSDPGKPGSATVHLGISASDGSYWRYEYGSGRGIEPATKEDAVDLDNLKKTRRRLASPQ